MRALIPLSFVLMLLACAGSRPARVSSAVRPLNGGFDGKKPAPHLYRIVEIDDNGVAKPGETFEVHGALRLTLPSKEWQVVTNDRRYDFQPVPVMILVNEKRDAVIRVSVFPTAEGTPPEVIGKIREDFKAAGSAVEDVVRDRAGLRASFTYRKRSPQSDQELGNEQGLVYAAVIAKGYGKSALLIGSWPREADSRMAKEFLSVAWSIETARSSE